MSGGGCDDETFNSNVATSFGIPGFSMPGINSSNPFNKTQYPTSFNNVTGGFTVSRGVGLASSIMPSQASMQA
jgi:hypothetical protein